MAASQNTYAALLAVSILLCASAIAFTSFTLWNKPSASNSQAGGSPETLAVTGTGKATGEFDQLVITVSAQAANNTLVEATQTIQSRVAAASRLFSSAGMSVQTAIGPSLTVGTAFSGTGTTTELSVQQTITFTVSGISSSDANTTEKVVGVVEESGLANLPSGTYSSTLIQVTYQFSPSLQNRLFLEAYDGAVQNATKDANSIASSEGLKVTGITQISQGAPATLTGPASIYSLYALLGLGYPAQAVEVDVQVTFAVQSA